MGRLVPRDGFAREVEIKRQSGSKVLRADKSGLYRAENPQDIKALKAEGFTESNLALHTTGDNVHSLLPGQIASWLSQKACPRLYVFGHRTLGHKRLLKHLNVPIGSMG